MHSGELRLNMALRNKEKEQEPQPCPAWYQVCTEAAAPCVAPFPNLSAKIYLVSKVWHPFRHPTEMNGLQNVTKVKVIA